MMVHEDERRILYDFASGDFKSAKAIVFRKSGSVGRHTHLNKDEEFFLLQGEFLIMQVGEDRQLNIKAPHHVKVPRGSYHKFMCEAGSILLCVSNGVYDEKDEIK